MKLDAKDCGIFIVDPTKPRPIDEEKQEKKDITKLRKFDPSCTNEIKVTSVLKERKREKRFFHLFEKIKRKF
jgi:poly-gamma-glutamate capsule biosynthesis protein CapA/YwtB (metallophosphatase superfamily)